MKAILGFVPFLDTLSAQSWGLTSTPKSHQITAAETYPTTDVLRRVPYKTRTDDCHWTSKPIITRIRARCRMIRELLLLHLVLSHTRASKTTRNALETHSKRTRNATLLFSSPRRCVAFGTSLSLFDKDVMLTI